MNKKPIDYAPIFEEFVDEELSAWPLAAQNYDYLNKITDNRQTIESFDEKIGERPWYIEKLLCSHRKASLSAKVDQKSLSERPCFLCKANRPEEQGAIEWENYEILLNPYPIGDPHFTIASKLHEPQRIAGRIKDMARLARMMPWCCVFYNGPLCGASAPDHLHFQATEQMLCANTWTPKKNLTQVIRLGKSTLYAPTPSNSLFPYFIIDSASDRDLSEIFDIVYNALPQADPEPMMNVVAMKTEGRMSVAIIPRRRHRPSFYGTGPDEMLISPASAEMLGLFITSRQEDFDRLDLQTVRRIYDEVTLSPEEFSEVIDRIHHAVTPKTK